MNLSLTTRVAAAMGLPAVALNAFGAQALEDLLAQNGAIAIPA